MKRRVMTTVFSRDDLLEIMENVEKLLKGNILSSLNTLVKETKANDSEVLVKHVLFTQLDENKDYMVFTRISNVCEKYLKVIPDIREKIESEIPDTVTSNTQNLNVKILISLISEGIYLTSGLSSILTYVINRFYTKTESDLDSKLVANDGHDLNTLIKLLPEFEKAQLNKIVETVGEIPTLRTMRNEETSILPAELVTEFFSTTFKIHDFYTQITLKRFLHLFNYKNESKQHSELSRQFTGNPIMHLRLFLVDIDMFRAEYHKEKAKLLDLRVLELRNMNNGTPDPREIKAIKFYEDKINKHNLKAKKLLSVKS